MRSTHVYAKAAEVVVDTYAAPEHFEAIDETVFRPLVTTMKIGVTAGASAPEGLVQEVIERLRELGVESVREMEGELETTVFKLPEELVRR